MLRLIYFSPAVKPEAHKRIMGLLKAIEKRHGIPWEEIVVYTPDWYGKRLMMPREEVYERYLKPSTSIIKTSSEILRSLGLDVLPEPASKKFRTRSGHIVVAGTVALAYGDVVVWASPYEGEVVQFLEKLYGEGRELIDKLIPDPMKLLKKASRNSSAGGVKEREVLRRAALELETHGYEVFVNVRHNILAGEQPTYMFSPDADIIAIKGSRVVGIEVKGSKGREPSVDQVYVGLGEALFYLINPIHFVYRGIRYEGGVFDEVYLLLPKIPKELEHLLTTMFRDLGVVGLSTLEQGLVVEPRPNPYVNREKKRILLENLHVLERYSYRPLG